MVAITLFNIVAKGCGVRRPTKYYIIQGFDHMWQIPDTNTLHNVRQNTLFDTNTFRNVGQITLLIPNLDVGRRG